jgi:decaprenylphospho-beta-D-erythro-pentofuranosid-2-ulose 2-reductase
VQNAFGDPQTIVLLGGTSDIGQATVRRLIRPSTARVVLASRNPVDSETFAAEVRRLGVETVECVAFDACSHATHTSFIAGLAERHGDLDVVLLAFGVLGNPDEFIADPASAAPVLEVNYVGGVTVGLAVANQLRSQGHGRMVIFSSVAGERVRKANYVYGSTKAGLDGFAQGLGDSLQGSGASLLVVRPGFVHSKMTAGMKPSALASTADDVAAAVERGLRTKAHTVWSPPAIRYVFSILRHLPRPIWRSLPL